ncbi:hypothetical protein IGI04_042754 [Brassica rapa subsp. trilocularis]|uniref:Uncharacterized protein n=1 Tax=Brassica rapa subsp. trilocularis TaxID=1813537 RepID=A0ABQ7KLT3_BRACM|nr:hypothetical protein IGI04_042754 [Brassica rapa subsp. trilocularis]
MGLACGSARREEMEERGNEWGWFSQMKTTLKRCGVWRNHEKEESLKGKAAEKDQTARETSGNCFSLEESTLLEKIEDVYENKISLRRVYEVKKVISGGKPGREEFNNHVRKLQHLWVELQGLRSHVDGDTTQEQETVLKLLASMESSYGWLVEMVLRGEQLPEMEEICGLIRRAYEIMRDDERLTMSRSESSWKPTGSRSESFQKLTMSRSEGSWRLTGSRSEGFRKKRRCRMLSKASINIGKGRKRVVGECSYSAYMGESVEDSGVLREQEKGSGADDRITRKEWRVFMEHSFLSLHTHQTTSEALRLSQSLHMISLTILEKLGHDQIIFKTLVRLINTSHTACPLHRTDSPSSLEPRLEGAKLVMILCISMELGCLNHHRESHKTHLSLHNDPCYTSSRLRTRYVQWYYAMAISHCILNHTTLPVDYGLTCPSDDMQWHKTFVFTFLVVGELHLLPQSPHNRGRLDRVAFFFIQPRVLLGRPVSFKWVLQPSALHPSCSNSPLHTQWTPFFLFKLGFDDELGTPFVNLKHHSNSSQDKTQLHWDQSLTSSSLITNVSSFITLDRIKTMSNSHKTICNSFKFSFNPCMQADSVNHTKHHYETKLSILITFSHQTKLLKYPGTDSKHFNLSIFNNPQVFNHITHYNQSTTQAHYQDGSKSLDCPPSPSPSVHGHHLDENFSWTRRLGVWSARPLHTPLLPRRITIWPDREQDEEPRTHTPWLQPSSSFTVVTLELLSDPNLL